MMAVSLYIDSSSVTGNLEYLVGAGDGVIVIGSGVDLIIDNSTANTPKFVVGGYADGQASTQTDDNKITLEKGNIGGNVYGGLAHLTEVNPGITCLPNCETIKITVGRNKTTLTSDNNQININNASSINGDIYSGRVAKTSYIDNINTLDQLVNDGKQHASLVSISATAVNANIQLASSKNTINMQGNDISAVNVISGSAENIFKIGNVKTGKLVNFSAQAGNSTFTYRDAVKSQDISAIENNIFVQGDNNKFNNLTSGLAGADFSIGSVQVADSIMYSDGNLQIVTGINIATNQSNTMVKANSNTIKIEGNTYSVNDVSGGKAYINFSLGNIKSGNFESTTISDFEDPVIYETKVNITNSRSSISADHNPINITGYNNTLNNLYGGYSSSNFNIGNITGGRTKLLHYIDYHDPDAGSTLFIDNATSVTVTFIDTNNTLSANENTIVLDGSSHIKGSIYGGYIEFKRELGEAKTADGTIVPIAGDRTNRLTATATNNEITINGNHTINSVNSHIYGGYLDYTNTKDVKEKNVYDVFTGNTLNYNNLKPIIIGTIANFQTYNFALDPTMVGSKSALITAEQIILGSSIDNLREVGDLSKDLVSDISVVGINSGKLIATGTEFVLMDSKALTGSGQGHGPRTVQQGISILYDVETRIEGNQIIAKIISRHAPDPGTDPGTDPETDPGTARINPQMKSLLEGSLSGLMLVTRGGDSIAYDMLNTIYEQNSQQGLVPFAYISGHHSRYKTGSHIDANGGLMTVGLSYQNDQLTLAAYLEHGTSDYDSYNSFINTARVHGKGDNRYYGAGLYGHYNFINGLYADATFRAGHIKTKYSTQDLRNATTSEAAAYTLKGKYLGAHLGLGYLLDINEANHMDVSLKYLWAQTDGDNLTIAGDPIRFNKLKSNRIRLNVENSYQFNSDWSLLSGLGVEYEFDGKARGQAYEYYNIVEPSVRGLTTIGTLGVRYKPASDDRLTVNFKGNAYVGKREGGSVSLQVQYAF